MKRQTDEASLAGTGAGFTVADTAEDADVVIVPTTVGPTDDEDVFTTVE